MNDVFEPKVKVAPGGASGAMAILSASIASVCCVLPPVLILVGLGSLGAGAFLGRYALPVLGAAVALLALAWWGYLHEAGKLRAIAAPMRNERRTRASLVLATVVIGAMAVLQGYSRALAAWERAVERAASARAAEAGVQAVGQAQGLPPAESGLARLDLPVEGMDCVTCEYSIERAVRALPGVREADASIGRNAVTVAYDPAAVTPEAIVAAVNSTGYRARLPENAAAAASRPADCCAQKENGR